MAMYRKGQSYPRPCSQAMGCGSRSIVTEYGILGVVRRR